MRALAYCPPEANGQPNSLTEKMRDLGAEVFTHMNQLTSFIAKKNQ